MAVLNRRLIAALAGALLAAGAAIAAPITSASAESNGGVRIMPLGDSITDGFNVAGGYRIGLWQRLVSGGYTVDFVGSLSNGPATLGDHDHEGHTGWRIDQLDANIVSWLRATTPRTVLLHIGTNDIIQGTDLPNAPARLSALIDHITATTPDAEVFVATITPLSAAAQEANVRTFNAAVPGLVQSKAAAGRHVHLVDMHGALTAADLADGIHPSATGYDKMATTWYAALRSVPGSLTNPGPTTPPATPPATTPPATTPPATTPPAGRGCTATYAVVGQWQGGFQASVKVTAGGSAIAGWTVGWSFAGGQTVSNAWGATVSGSGAAVSARNVSYNGAVGAGGSVEFGFLGTWTGSNPTPAALTCTAA